MTDEFIDRPFMARMSKFFCQVAPKKMASKQAYSGINTVTTDKGTLFARKQKSAGLNSD